MNEETVAQLKHENLKLLDELNHIKEHTFSVEEILNHKVLQLAEEKKIIKSLEQQNSSLSQMIKDKEVIISSLECERKKIKVLNGKLSNENTTLKGELQQEKFKNEQIEILKLKEEDLKKAYAKVKEQNQKLVTDLSLKSDECFSNAALIKDLIIQVKELENEKAELMIMRDTLLKREKEERLETSENLECFLTRSAEWSKSQHFVVDEYNLSSSSSNKDIVSLNLREEILEVELREKQQRISQLENLLREKEEIILARNKSIVELKKLLNEAGLLNYNFKTDIRLNSSSFYNIYYSLLRLVNWPEGQSAECKPLTDVTALSLVVKDGIQTTQPTSVRVVETISIASQTDPIKNLSPVLPFKTFEKSQSNMNSNQPQSDSDDEDEESLSFIKKDTVQKNFQLFSEPKNCDLDMDMYRSCRKLSVLPEEEVDESFNRKILFKKSHNSHLNNCNPKTLSVDDMTKIKTTRLPLRATSSCSNISPKNYKLTKNSGSFWEKHHSCDANVGNTITRNLQFDNKENELQNPTVSSKEVFRQPHSFDSYLDPLTRNSPLPRQTSDPTQNTVFAPPTTRRGSYLRRPRSTCRPLTLPCEKNNKKKEERVCKVRFDLNGIVPKKDDNGDEKEPSFFPVLNTAKKIKMVSRFRVEIIDEVEFRKSLEEDGKNLQVTRKRPPLVHSVVYKKSVFRDLKNDGDNHALLSKNMLDRNNFSLESPDSPIYDTATEDSPVESFDTDNNGFINDPYPFKRRRQSDASCYSFEDSQDSSEGNDILIKSIKLHSNSECIVMKELKKENSDSSCSTAESEIPFIDAEDLPVIKPSSDMIKIIPSPEIFLSESHAPTAAVLSPESVSEGSDIYLTPCDETPVSENSEGSAFTSLKSSGLSKSPTVLKNLANYELLATISESKKLALTEIIEEEKVEEQCEEKLTGETQEKNISDDVLKGESESLKRTSSDISEASESDTLTYGTVKSHMAASSDCDSDTYVTVWSDKSFTLERKFSDFSENSSSPYNTPPDTSSASFCTPPDTYSPILNSVKKHSSTDKVHRNYDRSQVDRNREDLSNNLCVKLDSSSLVLHDTCKILSENNEICFKQDSESVKPTEQNKKNYNVLFDSPKLEFYETNDSVENLEAFLQKEEGLRESDSKAEITNERLGELENTADSVFFETEEIREALSKRNSLESPKLLERRSKKHPPLSRQNSTEEYNFLDPHDSCLNLSEEISSPSTTPDTSNKTVIFKNVPLTLSNTIDLDDDFPVSETEIQLNFSDSQTEILGVPMKEGSSVRFSREAHCLSEPCTPSISSADFLEFSVPRKQRSSFTEESLMYGKSESNLPEIIVSRLSSDSENSDSEAPGYPETDFASNVSDRSEVHLSDVNSISGQSDNSGSISEHSDNVISDAFSSDSEKYSGVSPEITGDSSSPASDQTPPIEHPVQQELSSNSSVESAVLCDDFHTQSETGPTNRNHM